jgi:hypothetical protein
VGVQNVGRRWLEQSGKSKPQAALNGIRWFIPKGKPSLDFYNLLIFPSVLFPAAFFDHRNNFTESQLLSLHTKWTQM